MKVICDRSALADALGIVGGVVVARTPKPVFACVKFEALSKEAGLTLTATDGEIGLSLGVAQVSVEEPGAALVPADKLLQIVRTSTDPTLTIEMQEHAAHIRGADSHFTIYGYDPAEFPELRSFDEAAVDCEIAAGTLQRMISRTLFATAAESSRYAINGVLFDRKGKSLRLVATDGRRLALANDSVTPGKKSEEKRSCIVPSKALKLLGRLIDDPDAVVRLAIQDAAIIFSIGDGPDAAVLSSNLVEGAFPPFEDVIPKNHDKKITFATATLSSAVQRAALLTNEESKGVRMSFTSEHLTLSSRAPEMGEAQIEVALDEYKGEPIEIGFNPGFLVDALKVVDDMQVIVELKDSSKPGVIKAGNEFTYVVMPVNLQ
ncbi:MAG: DNA polymerase III subunit beta [Phycisphaerales bacterium]